MQVAEKQKNESITEKNLKLAERIVPKCGGLPKIIDVVAKSDRSFWENINDGLVTKLKKGPQFGHGSSQEGMDQSVESLPRTKNGGISRRLCIKPTRQVRELEFRNVMNDDISRPQVLKIDCSSALEVAFQTNSIATEVNVLIIHCYKGSDFRISVSGLKYLDDLDTVWLKGYDEKADYVVHLKKQIAAHPRKPVFKFEKLKSA